MPKPSIRNQDALSQAFLKEILHYDPVSGIFTWRVHRGRVAAGEVAGTETVGHILIRIERVRYLAHRLAWLYMTGEWPEHQIDHRDTDGCNNRWINLRPATGTQNGCNKNKTRRAKSSRFKGVTRRPNGWAVEVRINRKGRYIGSFADEVAAALAYDRAAREMHGEFARLNFPC